MGTKILSMVIFVALLAGPVVYADDQKKEIAPVNFAGQGEWLGVIEDVQDVDDSKWAEFQTKWKIPTVNRALANAVGAYVALATGKALDVFHVSNLLDFSGRSRLRDDPRTFQIFFKQSDGTVHSVVVHDQQMWEVGDKVKIVSDGAMTTVETIELGELSRYKAKLAAERGEK